MIQRLRNLLLLFYCHKGAKAQSFFNLAKSQILLIKSKKISFTQIQQILADFKKESFAESA